MKPQHWIGTDVGVVREHNEDAFLWMSPEDTEGHGYLWLIADGMGGEAAGEMASRTVIESVREIYPIAIDRLGDPYAAIEECFNAANRRILRIQQRSPEFQKMGTTAVCLAYYEDRAYISHVGDSRCYAWFAGELRQLTRDHTKLQLFLDAGALTEEEAEDHPAGHVLVNAIGRDSMTVDHNGETPIRIDNKVFLLCSDGLSGYVAEPLITEALDRMFARDATESLLELARQNWSEDNSSVAVIRFCEPEPDNLTDKDSFLQWASSKKLHRRKRDPTQKVRADVLPKNDEVPPSASISGVLETDGARKTHAADDDDGRSGNTGKLVGRKPVNESQDVDDEPQPEKQRKTSSPGKQTGRVPSSRGRTARDTDDRPTQGVKGLDKTNAKSQSSGQSTRGLPVPGTGQQAPVQTTASREISTDDRSRQSSPQIAGLGKTDVNEIRELRAAEEMGETDFLDMIGQGPKRKRNITILVGILLIIFVALLAVVLVDQLGDDEVEPIAEQTQEEQGNTSADEAQAQLGIDEEEGADEAEPDEAPMAASDEDPEEVPIAPSPQTPTPPSAILTKDSMPTFAIEDADGKRLYFDGHEVTVAQFRRIMQDDSTLQALHREIDAPRYEDAPCSSGISTDSSDPLEPVCVSPESATRYCKLVGRRLPTREDWRFAIDHGATHISVGNGKLHYFPRSGATSPVPANDEIDGIYGFFDGYPEILQSTELDSARGDIPVLGMESRARQEFESSPEISLKTAPISVQGSLRSRLQSGELQVEARPQLGFRCVVDESDYGELDKRTAVRQQNRRNRVARQPAAVVPEDESDESSSRIRRIEPFPDRETLEAQRAAREGQYPAPRNEPEEDAQDATSPSERESSGRPRTEGVLERIERGLNEN